MSHVIDAEVHSSKCTQILSRLCFGVLSNCPSLPASNDMSGRALFLPLSTREQYCRVENETRICVENTLERDESDFSMRDSCVNYCEIITWFVIASDIRKFLINFMAYILYGELAHYRSPSIAPPFSVQLQFSTVYI